MATTRSHFEIPGLLSPRPLNGRSSSRTDIFAPTPRFATASETSGQVTDSGARKRSRYDGEAPSHTADANPWADSSLRSSNARSPPPLANDRYRLVNGMEASDNRFGRHNGDYDDYYQLEKQRGMWATPTSTPFGLQNQLSTVDDTMRPTPESAKPWVFNQLMSIVGGVAGKLVQFCAVPFRGFQAGGGQAYTFDDGVAARLGLQDDPFDNSSTAGPIQQPRPGDYPEDNYGVLSIDSVENERPRLSKRLKTGESWVVVDKEGGMDSRPSTPRLSERRVPQQARSSSIPRPMSRAGPAMVTPKRPSLIPISRRSTMDRKSLQGTSKALTNPCTTPRSYSRQSYGSPVMFENKAKKSPLPPDSQRLINKMRREEMEEDARMRRMSSQMSSMLREAREALGSKIEVEYDEMDEEGYSDKSWYQR
ncbi:hypothetical protein K505DRAFT_237208 [Melanomma pulvis-pyrius CBS 109.77]|uniref:Uncharacterized protein n=1 Tax=Melanomma pulvis-pyrius CBS 109.77 TaxID=1314802 RepID=A0A6A6XJP0_9PLEO|nr:hypothetical protein K505DRAFT_237208 [Melanomma pulvis-pyrius CBS 109.77]